MILRKIILKNIRSYSSEEIEFPTGSLLLAGDVGAGKTSLLLAVEYALFGLQPGQNSAALLRNNSLTGEVRLFCEIDGREIILERKLRRGSKNIESEYASITINGIKHESSITELKKKVLTLLGYPSEFIKKNNLLYRYTVYTPQEQMKHIILEDPEIRLNILRHVFGVDKYKIIRENTQKLTVSFKEDAKMLQVEIKSLETDNSLLGTLKDKMILLTSQYDSSKIDLEEAVKKKQKSEDEQKKVIDKFREKEKFEAELEKANVMIVSKREALSSLEKDHLKIQEAISGEKQFNDSELKAILEKIALCKKEQASLNEEFIRAKSEISHLSQRERESISKKERIFSISHCPTCLQDVPQAHKHNIFLEVEKDLSMIKASKLSIAEMEVSLSLNLADQDKLLSELEQKKSLLENLREKSKYIEQERIRLAEISKATESVKRDISLLENHNHSLKEGLFTFSNLGPVLKEKDETLKKSLLEEKQVEIRLAEIKKEQELTEKEISQLLIKIQEKEDLRKKMLSIQEAADWLSNDFTSLIQFTESSVLLQLRSEFSRIFSKWFHILAPESFEVHLDETFTPIIMQGDIEMDYNFLSGGERTAVALAYRLALNQTINSVMSQMRTRDLLILDEPTEGFSEAQLEKMRDVLGELNVKQLILVSHEQKIESFVEHVLKIKKEGGNSSLE